MGHDERADQPSRDAPGGIPDVFETAGRGLEGDLEGASEVLAQEVARPGLEGLAVLHQGFAAVGAERPANRSLSVLGPVITGIAIHSSMKVR